MTRSPVPTTLEVTRRGAVLHLHLAGGLRHNVIGKAVVASLSATLDNLGDGIGAVVISADPPDFCTGFDLVEAARDGAAGLIGEAGSFRAVRDCPVPVVAAIHGRAIGGGLELLLSCDVRVACPDATFLCPAAGLGLVYSDAGLGTLVETLGMSETRRMVLAGGALSANTAASRGIVELADCSSVDKRAIEVAQRIAGWPRHAVAGNLAILNAIARRPEGLDVDELHAQSLESPELVGAAQRFASRHGY